MSVAIARTGDVNRLQGAKYDVLILVCSTGDELEAAEFCKLFPSPAEARLRARAVVLVGRIGAPTLRLLGAFVKHVVALPATAETQPGGALWAWWKANRGDAQPWETLTLDWTHRPADAKFIRTEWEALHKMKIAEQIVGIELF